MRLFIEFEEEIGSPKLTEQITQIKRKMPGFFDVDAMVLTDCDNLTLEVPGFTRSLRGVVEADVCCRRTDDTGVDPSIALCLIVSQLLDHRDGRPTFSLVGDISKAERRELEDSSDTRRRSGQDADAPLLPQRDDGRSDMEWAWRQPALTVKATSLKSTTEAKETNCIRPQAALQVAHPNDDDLRQAMDKVLLKPSTLAGVTFSSASRRQPAKIEAQCSTGRKAEGHSGIYGSIWSDPSCLMMLRVDRLVGELEEAGHARLVTRLSIKATSLPTIADPPPPDTDTVCARLSIRTPPPPGKTVDEVLDEVECVLKRSAEALRVDVELKRRKESGFSEAWLYDTPDCNAFDAARRAYKDIWGHPPATIGVGGSIPFIKTFADHYEATTPLILNGVLDPASALHAPNESLHLGLFEKAVLTNVRLLYEFGKIRKGEFLLKASQDTPA